MNEAVSHHTRLIAEPLRRRTSIPDDLFDVIFPQAWRTRSRRFWTPVDVALRAASWFADSGVRRVLDVGSGVGKFCVVGALSTDLEFVGIEHRPPLVDAAREAASALGVADRARFVCRAVDSPSLAEYGAFYLYNPFGENLHEKSEQLDANVELGIDRYDRDVGLVERALRAAPVGTRLVTFCGFGGRIPNSYVPERVSLFAGAALRSWVRRRVEFTGYYIETGDERLIIDTPSEPLAGPRSER